MNKGKKIGLGKSAEVFCWGSSQVIKLFYANISTACIEYETKVTQTIYQAGLSVPRVQGIVLVDERKGIVSDRIMGDSMLNSIRLKPWKIFYFARLLAKLQTKIHQCDAPQLIPLRQQRQLQIKGVKALPEIQKQVILNLLDRLPIGKSLCHGDFHPGNVILSASGCVAIDWPNAVRGHSHADVARTLLLLVAGETPTNLTSIPWLLFRILFGAIYLQHYLKLNRLTLEQICPWLLPEAAAWLSHCSSGQEQKSLLFIIERLLKNQYIINSYA